MDRPWPSRRSPAISQTGRRRASAFSCMATRRGSTRSWREARRVGAVRGPARRPGDRCDEKPAQAMRRGKGSSMWNAVETVRAGRAQAAVSAGNTGALMAISKLILRMVGRYGTAGPGRELADLRGRKSVLDVGANIDCDAQRLVEFAIVGEAFHQAVHGAARPSVGLLNVGSEEQKGHDEVREAHRILRERGLDVELLRLRRGRRHRQGHGRRRGHRWLHRQCGAQDHRGRGRFVRDELRAALTALRCWPALAPSSPRPRLRRMARRFDPARSTAGLSWA